MKKEYSGTNPNRHHGAQSPDTVAATIIRSCNLLERAEIKSCQFLYSGSNNVFLATLAGKGAEIKAVYKPRQGETPLWDFPYGTLYQREYATFLLSQALEWYLIPATVIRDGPYGIGSMQWFVNPVNRPGYYTPLNGDHSLLKQVALFDYLVNNADRKAGHFLQDEDGRLWVIDHGLTFHTVPKLRTVLWDFSGQAVPEKLLAAIRVLREKMKQDKTLLEALYRLLEADEVAALEHRIKRILEKPVFVYPEARRSVPWPWV